jgi:ABC-type oligopeptide transport system ATPase subunit
MAAMTEVLLRAEQLGKQFALAGRESFWAVRDASFDLHVGEALGLVGESGCGKSTLGRLLLGLHDKSAGSAYFRGERLPRAYRQADFHRYAQQMQMVFQDPYGTLNPRFTVGSSIAEPLILLGQRAGLSKRVAQALERVGLSPAMADRYPHEFSGGQRQRIGIARALITEPALLICDEPVSALDVSVQAQIINLLMQLQREMQLSLIFISHDLGVVRHLCNRIAVMQGGRIVELADKNDLFAAPQHEFTRKLLAARSGSR